MTNEIFTKVVALILVGSYPLIKHATPSDRPGDITALKTAPGTDLTTVLSADTPSFLDEGLAACGTAGHRPDHGIHEVRNVVDRCFSRLSSSAIPIRVDAIATRYRAGLRLAALVLWLRGPGRDCSPVTT
ncbi:hypothetical protein [Streptomyces eurythermus]